MSTKFIAIVVESSCGGDASVDVHELGAQSMASAKVEAERFVAEYGGTSSLYVVHALAWEELDPGVIERKQYEARRKREVQARADAREAKLFQLRGEVAALERLVATSNDPDLVEFAGREVVERRERLAKLEAE